MIADTILTHIKTIYTPFHEAPVRGAHMKEILSFHHAYIAIKDQKIIDIGEKSYEHLVGEHTHVIDMTGRIAVPGFIDSHTHLVHAGSREHEYELLKKGVPYLEILKNGGGILGTVEKTRNATFKELYEQAFNSLDHMLRCGVTTVESKSGYGLNLETEKKQLRVNQALNDNHPIRILSTYMGAHAVPLEYKHRKDEYIVSMKEDMKHILEQNLAQSVDVFCEEGVFSIEEANDILSYAKELGFNIKMHADEIHSLGGAGLGASLGCSSVDHLMAISDQDIQTLANSSTVANVLPGTSFFLKKGYAPARKMIDAGVILSIAGDYNPGSCPSENFLHIMHLASNHYGLLPEEVLHATTLNPAFHLGISSQKGSLEVGKDADIVILDAPNFSYVLYHFGINHTTDVFIKGKHVVKNRTIVRE